MLGLNKLTLVAMALCRRDNMTKQKEEKSKARNSKLIVILYCILVIELVVLCIVVACPKFSAQIKHYLSDQNPILAISDANDGGNQEPTGDAQGEAPMSAENVWTESECKGGENFDREHYLTERIEYPIDSETNAPQANKNMLFQNEIGNLVVEGIFEECIDPEFKQGSISETVDRKEGINDFDSKHEFNDLRNLTEFLKKFANSKSLDLSNREEYIKFDKIAENRITDYNARSLDLNDFKKHSKLSESKEIAIRGHDDVFLR